jgi:hypothetical protein
MVVAVSCGGGVMLVVVEDCQIVYFYRKDPVGKHFTAACLWSIIAIAIATTTAATGIGAAALLWHVASSLSGR